MNITADSVKQLRERTGAGFMECKKALVESKGDLDAAARRVDEFAIPGTRSHAARDSDNHDPQTAACPHDVWKAASGAHSTSTSARRLKRRRYVHPFGCVYWSMCARAFPTAAHISSAFMTPWLTTTTGAAGAAAMSR